MSPIEQRIHYKFRNSLLLAEALTHPSLGHETQNRHFDNQRLEFLGDAVLQLVFTELLFKIFPAAPEGDLTKLRARLVSRDGLKKYAINLGLGDYLLMGRGEEANGGRQRPSTLADAFEAVVGAMYLDSDLQTVREFVLQSAADEIENLKISPVDVNPKGMLQEILQSFSPLGPSYAVLSESGPEHMKTFISKVEWNGIELGRGTGRSKKESECEAAFNALEQKRWAEPENPIPNN
jgi:ribonuclease III